MASNREETARILVVDDHEEMVHLVADLLSHAGYDVERALGGVDALRCLRNRIPDLVVTELFMSDVDGFELLAAIHEVARETRVIAMASVGEPGATRDALQRGARQILVKPFKLADLLAAVVRTLATDVNSPSVTPP